MEDHEAEGRGSLCLYFLMVSSFLFPKAGMGQIECDVFREKKGLKGARLPAPPVNTGRDCLNIPLSGSNLFINLSFYTPLE